MYIEGQQTILRQITFNDLKHIQGWINDLEVQYYAQEEFPLYFNYYDIKKIYQDGINGKKIIFIIEDKNNIPIGELWLFPIDIPKKVCELIITIGSKDYRSKGYGMDAILSAKKICFEILKLNKIYLKVFSFNIRAIKCYKKCGFKVIGNLKRKVSRYGVKYNIILMELSKL